MEDRRITIRISNSFTVEVLDCMRAKGNSECDSDIRECLTNKKVRKWIHWSLSNIRQTVLSHSSDLCYNGPPSLPRKVLLHGYKQIQDVVGQTLQRMKDPSSARVLRIWPPERWNRNVKWESRETLDLAWGIGDLDATEDVVPRTRVQIPRIGCE